MDKPLDLYIQRAEEILKFDISKKKKYDKYENEYKNMISFLEFTLIEVKNKYKEFSEQSVAKGYNKIEESKDSDKGSDKDCDKDGDKIGRVEDNDNVNDIYCCDNSSIKYNEETNQYLCTIDNIELRGNLGNIYDRNILRNDKIQAHQVLPCHNGNKCYNILRQKYCKFYHDPNDLLLLKEVGVISENFYRETIQYTRNFASTSWLYSPFLSNNKYNMRSFGSKNTLEHDIRMTFLRKTGKDELKNFKAQVMHDILVLKKIESMNLD